MRRPDAVDAAETRRRADRTAGIATQREIDQFAGRRRGRTAGRATRRVRHVDDNEFFFRVDPEHGAVGAAPVVVAGGAGDRQCQAFGRQISDGRFLLCRWPACYFK